jgi:hypothetical protein
VTTLTGRAAVPAPVRVHRAVAGAVLTAAALAGCYIALADLARPARAVVWGSVALACYATGLLLLLGAGQPGLGLARWKLGPWILLWYGLASGLATVTWAGPQTSTAAQVTLASVLRALWLVAVGMTAWAAGYAAGPGAPLRRLAAGRVDTLAARIGGTVRSRSTPWILYAAGALARLAAAATSGRFGYVGDAASAVSTATGYGQILSDLSLLAPLGLAAAAIQVYRERLGGARVTLAVLFLAELAFGAAAGGKESFVIALLAVLIPMSAAKRRLPALAVIGGIVAFLWVVIPFNQAYRGAARGDSATLSVSQAVHQAPSILRQTLSGHNLLTVAPDSVVYLLQRIREIDSPAVILQRTPGQIPFSSPAQLALAPLADVVPRAIWPGKPILATGYQFSQEYYDLPSSVYTSSAVTPVGDLYRHGGWVPVVAGMMLLGCAVRLADDVLDVRANPQAVFAVLLLFPVLVTGEQDWVTMLAGLPATALIWLLASAVTFRRSGRAA